MTPYWAQGLESNWEASEELRQMSQRRAGIFWGLTALASIVVAITPAGRSRRSRR